MRLARRLTPRTLRFTTLFILFCALAAGGCQAPAASPAVSPDAVLAPEPAILSKVPVPKAGAYVGVTIDFNGRVSVPDQLAEYETLTGYRPAIGAWYITSWSPNLRGIRLLDEAGVVPLITFEPRRDSLQDLLAGQGEQPLREWARALRDFGRPVFFRFAHEMNGDWYPWSGAHNGAGQLDGFGDPARPDGPERYVAAYRRVHAIFEAEGALNVTWVWSPNVLHGTPADDWNWPDNYYPGDAYVDWIGMDGYNWGATAEWTRWQSFDEIFGESYAAWAAAHDKPVMIAEFASAEAGGDKGQWIAEAGEAIQAKYPRVRAVVWFNLLKETDWRVNSSPAALNAYSRLLAQPHFVDTIPQVSR